MQIRNKKIAKCRKLIVANEYNHPLNVSWFNSAANRAIPKIKPPIKAVSAPGALIRFQNSPSRKMAAIGGAIQAWTLCR